MTYQNSLAKPSNRFDKSKIIQNTWDSRGSINYLPVVILLPSIQASLSSKYNVKNVSNTFISESFIFQQSSIQLIWTKMSKRVLESLRIQLEIIVHIISAKSRTAKIFVRIKATRASTPRSKLLWNRKPTCTDKHKHFERVLLWPLFPVKKGCSAPKSAAVA